MKIPVCAGLHYARPFPPNHSVLRDTTPNVGKRVKMTPLPLSSPPFYAFSFFLFYDVPRLESRDSIFLRCLYIYNVCVYVCVCGCVQEDWCVFRDEETGGWFRWKSRGIIRRIDEQNIFPSSFDRYYVLEFFDILEYWNRDAWEVWVLRCWRWNEIILHAWCGFIGHLHVNS